MQNKSPFRNGRARRRLSTVKKRGQRLLNSSTARLGARSEVTQCFTSMNTILLPFSLSISFFRIFFLCFCSVLFSFFAIFHIFFRRAGVGLDLNIVTRFTLVHQHNHTRVPRFVSIPSTT